MPRVPPPRRGPIRNNRILSLLRKQLRRRPATPPFASPDSIPGLAMWLDASDYLTLTLNGGFPDTYVAEWRDKGALGYDLAQDTAVEQPFFTESPSPGVRFTAGQRVYRQAVNPTALGASATTLFMVIAVEDPSQIPWTFGGVDFPGNEGNERFLVHYPATTAYGAYAYHGQYWAGDENIAVTGFPPSDVTARHIVMFRRSGEVMSLAQNGVPYATSTANTYGPITATDGTIGIGEPSGQSAIGTIHEVLVWSNALEPSDITAVVNYLSAKWQIPLP